MKIAAVIVSAGTGTRAGGDRPKQYQDIGGEMVLRHTLRAFVEHPQVSFVQAEIGRAHV
jgi:2-C-methyl-D-erythritol 4-phosphate cytidylyltransferase/2-C-methyl-D-erythritol 2,4-cyclodiphosphate synthase